MKKSKLLSPVNLKLSNFFFADEYVIACTSLSPSYSEYDSDVILMRMALFVGRVEPITAHCPAYCEGTKIVSRSSDRADLFVRHSPCVEDHLTPRIVSHPPPRLRLSVRPADVDLLAVLGLALGLDHAGLVLMRTEASAGPWGCAARAR